MQRKMSRREALNLFKFFHGTITPKEAMSLTDREIEKCRELATLLVELGFWPVQSAGMSAFIYDRLNLIEVSQEAKA